MFVIQIIDVCGEILCLLMPSVIWNIGGRNVVLKRSGGTPETRLRQRFTVT